MNLRRQRVFLELWEIVGFDVRVNSEAAAPPEGVSRSSPELRPLSAAAMTSGDSGGE